jgi:hypothetical protein
MEPVTAFGAAASALQVADAAARVFISVYQYYRNVKDAPLKARILRNELQNELQNLSTLLDATRGSIETAMQNPVRYQIVVIPLGELKRLVLEMEERVKEEKMVASKRLKWPFTEKENDRLISQIQRYRTDLILALNIDQR